MTENLSPAQSAKSVAVKLLDHCRANDWAGYDPYDALNSRLLQQIPLLDFRLSRLALTQILKRLPFNPRPLLLVPKTQNPKGLALFLSASTAMPRDILSDDGEGLRRTLMERLIALRSASSAQWCWGYSFSWQTRTVLVPRGEANLVCTVFVATALLDAYEKTGRSEYLDMATSAATYLLTELFWEEGEAAGFAYPLPSSRARVHNANFLGAALLCRVYHHSREQRFLDAAMTVVRYSARKQANDGSWEYGELSTQRWIDNFHTGYNLCALREIGVYAETSEFEERVRRGFQFYRSNFFRQDGAPKYFHDRSYPIDIHSVAQSILTLVKLRDIDANCDAMARSVFEWALAHMWDDRGFFYYRAFPFFRIKIDYMRWSQAWMLLALTRLIESSERRMIGGNVGEP